MLWEKENEEIQAKIKEMHAYCMTLIYPDGRFRPGVTKEQVQAASDAVKKMSAMLSEFNQNTERRAAESQKSRDKVINHILGMRKKYGYDGKDSHPLLKKMFGI